MLYLTGSFHHLIQKQLAAVSRIISRTKTHQSAICCPPFAMGGRSSRLVSDAGVLAQDGKEWDYIIVGSGMRPAIFLQDVK